MRHFYATEKINGHLRYHSFTTKGARDTFVVHLMPERDWATSDEPGLRAVKRGGRTIGAGVAWGWPTADDCMRCAWGTIARELVVHSDKPRRTVTRCHGVISEEVAS